MKTFYNTFINESIKAEDYEAAIVIGFYELHNVKFNPETVGINSSIYDAIIAKPSLVEVGKKISTKILEKFPELKNAKAEQFGRQKTSLTSFWSSFGASNTTPKTDVLIGDKRFSLKMGAAQLMSGGKDESIATFNAALKKSNTALQSSKEAKAVQTILDNFITASVAPEQLRGIIKSGENEIVNAGEKAHKDIMNEMGKLFESNKQFKIEFAREAMSGFSKFGEDSLATAEYMLVCSKDGETVNIHSVYDDKYCSKIADNMKLQARFKTSSRKLQGKKTGEYNYWSVVSLIIDATKDMGRVNEGIFDNISKYISDKYSKIKSYFNKKIVDMFDFLGIEPDITYDDTIEF